ncbi:MAG: leucine-rich repeat domain-containing protein [Lachnospiraceae bacterium]
MKKTACKSNVTAAINWKIEESGLLIIEGDGKMPDYSCGKNPASPWEDKKDCILSVFIGEGITEIGINAFRDCFHLKKVILPKTLKRIQAYAFRDCISLEQVEAGDREWRYVYDRRADDDNVIIFGVETFLNVPWTKSRWGNFYCCQDALYVCFSSGDRITIPEGIRILKSFCFSDIQANKIILPESLEEIEGFAFSQTSATGRLRIPDGICTIDPYAFADSRFCSISFPTGWNPQKMPWARGEVKMSQRQRFPKLIGRYSVGHIKNENLGKFRRLQIVENKPIRHKNGQVTAILEGKPVDVGASMLRRMYSGRILICVSYEDNRVTSVKSFSWAKDYGLVNEYLMYPVQMEDEKVEIWSDSFTWQEQSDVRYAFWDQDGKALKEAGVLRFRQPDAHEEWFWAENDGNFGGPMELEFLKSWMKMYPEVVIDSAEENRENGQYRWFVGI